VEDGISGGLQHRHETCCEKGGHHGRRACMVQRWFHREDVVSGPVDLYMICRHKGSHKLSLILKSPVMMSMLLTLASVVVATTRRNSTHSMLTSAKLTEGYLVVGIYKRTRQGALAAFIYYIYTWLLVHATTISIWPLSPCRYLMFITHPPCVYLKATMLPTCALTSYL